MKKKLLTLLSILILASTLNVVDAKTTSATQLTEAIKLYKGGNYSECYQKLTKFVNKNPDNAVAYYYLAMSAAQAGKTSEAISSYSRAISLTSESSNLNRYAKRGKACLEEPDKCEAFGGFASLEEAFILNKNSAKISDEVKSEMEKLKLEQLMRDMNRSKDIQPERFREHKDFSTMNTPTTTPSNDEIVAALKTLQNAGFSNILNNNYSTDLSMLTGAQNQQFSLLDMMNQGSSINPQLIQTMLTNNMRQGF